MKYPILLLVLCLLLTTAGGAVPGENRSTASREKDDILSALYESDIASAREALDKGLITSVELTQYFLDRIATYNDTFHCFITLCDNALVEAEKRDMLLQEGHRSPLLGIPIVVKDNIAYEGYPTTNGYYKFSEISRSNATVVQTLLDAGAVILGKTNMSTNAEAAEYTVSDAVGETPNAYDPSLSAGGSSGGSAVAVSLNFCYAGLGTDTNASLRYPAVLNGCISLRPTKGLLDREGIDLLNGTRDVPGVITRSLRDQAIVLGALTGEDYETALDENALVGKRIGVLLELSYGEEAYSYRVRSKMDTEIQAAFQEAVEHLKALGAKVFPVSISNLYPLAENCSNNNPYAIEKYFSVYETLFQERDLNAVIFPTYLHTPDESPTKNHWNVNHEYFYSNCSLLSSPLGVPEIAIPIGYHSTGAGIGMEIAALKGQEALLLSLAYSYTCHYDTRRAPDTAPNLYENENTLWELLENREASTEPTTEPTEEIHPPFPEETHQEEATEASLPPVEIPVTTLESSAKKPIILFLVVTIPLWVTGISAYVKAKKRKKEGVK